MEAEKDAAVDVSDEATEFEIIVTEFSDKDFVGKNIHKDMGIYAYYECNDELGDLKSFQIVLANADKENRTLLEEVGPSSAMPEEENSAGDDITTDEFIEDDEVVDEGGARRLQDSEVEEPAEAEAEATSGEDTELD